MTSRKISADPSAGTLTGAEIVPVVSGGANKRTTTQAIADLAAGGSVPTGTGFRHITAGTEDGAATTLAALKTDLGLTGTNSGDQDLSGLATKAANLSDLASAATARTNLGLGSLATQDGTFSGTSSGTNTGDQTITLTGDVTGSGTASFGATLATVNANVGTFGSATQAAQVTLNAKGLATAAANVTVTPAVGSITGLGTGIAAALAVNVGSAGAPVVNGGALGTPSGGTLTNATGLPPAGVTGTAAVLGANGFTDTQTVTKSIAATSTDGFVLTNTTAAAAGSQQWSPRIHWTGRGWKTTATAASQSVDWIAEVVPYQGTAAPTSGLQISSSINGGAYTAKATFDSSGRLWFGPGGASVTPSIGPNANGTSIYNQQSMALMSIGETTVSSYNGIGMRSDTRLGWSSTTTPEAGSDVILTRAAAANIRQGASDAAAPVAQTSSVQSVVAGTSNTAGVTRTYAGSAGTGTGAGGSHVFTVAPAGSTGTAQNAQANAWGIDGNQTLYPAAKLSTSMTKGFLNIPSGAGAPSGTPANTTGVPLYFDSTNLKLYAYTGGAWKSSAVFT